MPSLIQELQHAVLDAAVRTPDLLRKAKVVSRKLKISEFEQWTELELNAYGEETDVPSCRRVRGQVMAWHPYTRQWEPLAFEDLAEAALYSEQLIAASVAEIEEALTRRHLVMGLHPSVEAQLNQTANVRTRMGLSVSRAVLRGIVDTVRNTILDWALELEENGIVGEGLSFSPREKGLAGNPFYHNVAHFHGNVSGSQIQQGTSDSTIHGETNS